MRRRNRLGVTVVVARRAIAAALVAVSASTEAAAQPLTMPAREILGEASAASSPPQLPPAPITMQEAVRLTLTHDPATALARQEISFTGGQLREARGAFDTILSARTTFNWSHTALQPFIRAREQQKRDQLRFTSEAFRTVDLALRRSLSGLGRPPRCPVGFDFTLTDRTIRIDRQDPTERNLMGIQRDLGDALGADLRSSLRGLRLTSVCTPPSDIATPTQAIENFWRGLDTATGRPLGLNQFLANAPQVPNEVLGFQQQLANTIATRAALGLVRLGVVPLDEVRRDVTFEASLGKPLRSGWLWSGQFRLSSSQRTYVDKPLDVSFGGAEDPILFPSFVTLNLTVPLARGGGRRTVEAPERAAAINQRGEASRTRHAATEGAFRTVLAYLNVVAAQERLQYLEESAKRQQQLLENTKQLVTAGELPTFEFERASARAATAAAAVSDARRRWVEARVGLAEAMGVDVANADALPGAQERFSEGLKNVPGVQGMIQAALQARHDRRALLAFRESAGILSAAATADLRSLYDVTISGGLANTYDNPLFRFLPDEQEPVLNTFPVTEQLDPTPEPVRFATLQGFGRSLSGRWEPFVGVSVSYDLAQANNRFRGRAAQAAANVRRSTIETENLERIIQDNVARTLGTMSSSRAVIAQRREAITRERTSLEGSLELFRAGDVTLLDTIVSEDNLIREQLRLVDDLLTYFSTLARLKFETGELVRFDGEGLDTETVVFDPRDFVSK